MGWIALATAVISSAGSSSSGGSGTNIQTDAYKGDGPQGVGTFLQGVGKAYGLTDTNTSGAYNRLNPQDKARLDTHVTGLINAYKNSVFTKGAARLDSGAAVDAVFKKHRDTVLPKLYGKACAVGLYNSSAMQLLANDAYARTTTEASTVQLSWIETYGKIHLQEASTATEVLNVLTRVYEDSSSETHVANKPDISQFGKDAAKYLIFMGIIDWVSRANYFADQTAKEDTAGSLLGGAVDTAINSI